MITGSLKKVKSSSNKHIQRKLKTLDIIENIVTVPVSVLPNSKKIKSVTVNPLVLSPGS